MHIATTTISPETFLAIMTVAALVGTLASLGRPRASCCPWWCSNWWRASSWARTCSARR